MEFKKKKSIQNLRRQKSTNQFIYTIKCYIKQIDLKLVLKLAADIKKELILFIEMTL